MRINEYLEPQRHISSESRMFLQKIIDEICYNPPIPIEFIPGENDKELIAFYDRFYVTLDSQGYIPADCQKKDLEISSFEQSIIEFCINPKSETRIFVLHGHTGVGKSSLVRRIVYYVYPTCPTLQASFFPIYIRLRERIVSENSEEFFNTIAEIITEKTYEKVKKIFSANSKTLLQELNKIGSLDLKFSREEIDNAGSMNFEEWLNKRFIGKKEKNYFFFSLTKLLIAKRMFHLVLFIDDVDRHSIEVHSSTFWALDNLADFGIFSVVSMRTSTYENKSSEIMEYRDQKLEIKLNSEIIKGILSKRISLLDETIFINPKIAFTIKELKELSGEQIVGSFNKLISRPPCISALVGLSNTNIKSIFLKIDLMAKSEAFSDEFVVHQLMEKELLADGEKTISSKIWVFYHLLLGNYAGTFRRDPQARKAGIINLFDASLPSNSPWRHFLRVNLLIYMYKHWQLTRNDDDYIFADELVQQVKAAFGATVDKSLLFDSIWALVESELVYMASCKRYTKDLISRDFLLDGIMISPAGRFYLENLLHKVEYLYFIKDDINWDLEELPVFLTPARRDYRRQVKFSAVMQALQILQEAELNGLGELRAYWEGTLDGDDAMTRYRDQFSPFGILNYKHILITEVLQNSYLRFMTRTMGESFQTSDVKELSNQMIKHRRQNNGTIKAFRSA